MATTLSIIDHEYSAVSKRANGDTGVCEKDTPFT